VIAAGAAFQTALADGMVRKDLGLRKKVWENV
jgi:hypothetical protein